MLAKSDREKDEKSMHGNKADLDINCFHRNSIIT